MSTAVSLLSRNGFSRRDQIKLRETIPAIPTSEIRN
jgi:hypothetical protein